MNNDPAIHIPISEILSKLSISPVSATARQMIYPSPFHSQKVPTLTVDPVRNEWFDRSIGAGGNLLDFVRLYLKAQGAGHTPPDIQRWIMNMTTEAVAELPQAFAETDESRKRDEAFVVKSKGAVTHPGLIQYLEKQGIPLETASEYLLELRLLDRQAMKRFRVLGFANEEGGYEIQSPHIQGSVRPQALSFVRGRVVRPTSIHVFSSFWDYLSLVSRNGQGLLADSIVLNALSCLPQVPAYLRHYGYEALYSWLDNTEEGGEATSYLTTIVRSIPELSHRKMNGIYAPHADVHTWHRHRAGLIG